MRRLSASFFGSLFLVVALYIAYGIYGILTAPPASPRIPGSAGEPLSQKAPRGDLPVPSAGKVLPPPPGKAYLGVFTPDAPFAMHDLTAFEDMVGREVAILQWFQPWGVRGRNAFYLGVLDQVGGENVVPLIAWEPWDPAPGKRPSMRTDDFSAYKLTKISRGDYDYYIRYWARSVRFYGGPVMIRLMHEMNGDWYPWGGTVNGNKPSDFKKAWRHVHDIFRQEGATNVSWVWSVNAGSIPDTKENRIAVYYPGRDYVDWVAISGFNLGTSEPWSRWRSLKGLYRRPYDEVVGYHKPIMLAEVSSVEQGGDKARWIKEGIGALKKDFPQVKAVVWYNGIDGPYDFRVTSSKASARAFKVAVADSYFVSRASFVERPDRRP